MDSPACLNCGERLHGEYCSHCGQPVHEGRKPTVKHFLHDAVHEFLHVDGRLGRTAKTLVFQPGRLTAEYWAGRIAQYIRPLRMFLVVVAINLLLVHDAVGPLNFHVGMEKNAAGDTNVTLSQDREATKHRAGYGPVPEAERKEFF